MFSLVLSLTVCLLMFIVIGLKLKLLLASLEDVRITSGAAASVVGPAAMWLGARLRAHI